MKRVLLVVLLSLAFPASASALAPTYLSVVEGEPNQVNIAMYYGDEPCTDDSFTACTFRSGLVKILAVRENNDGGNEGDYNLEFNIDGLGPFRFILDMDFVRVGPKCQYQFRFSNGLLQNAFSGGPTEDTNYFYVEFPEHAFNVSGILCDFDTSLLSLESKAEILKQAFARFYADPFWFEAPVDDSDQMPVLRSLSTPNDGGGSGQPVVDGDTIIIDKEEEQTGSIRLTHREARHAVKVSLKEKYRSYRRGHARTTTCERVTATKLLCAASWRIKGTKRSRAVRVTENSQGYKVKIL